MSPCRQLSARYDDTFGSPQGVRHGIVSVVVESFPVPACLASQLLQLNAE